MVKLIIVGCVILVAFGVLSAATFLAATAFVACGYAITWKMIALFALAWFTWKRVK